MTKIAMLALGLASATLVSHALFAGSTPSQGPFDVRYLCVASVEGSPGTVSERSSTLARTLSFPVLGDTGISELTRTEADFLATDGTLVDLSREVHWARGIELRVNMTFTRENRRKLVSRKDYVWTGAKCLNLNLSASVAGLSAPLRLYAADCVGVDAEGRPSQERSAAFYETSVSLGIGSTTARVRIQCERDLGYAFGFNL